ncbi:MAG: type II toxin-antitoxin system PemK/MazF family toxin [Armatimonadetes bacterium]|nr:type II toxin-antitoxin system PemK/MazF family toxin [Armatimonadota bacterium]
MTPNPVPERGDVILVLFPNSDLVTAKTRPALVVQAYDLQTGLPQVIVAMITSRMTRSGHPSRVAVLLSTSEGKQSGLLTDSVLNTWTRRRWWGRGTGSPRPTRGRRASSRSPPTCSTRCTSTFSRCRTTN